MRVKQGNTTKLWLSAIDTYRWAHKPGAAWPGSVLSNKRLFAEFAANGDLVDLCINNGHGEQDCPADELNACMMDLLGTAHPHKESAGVCDTV